MPLPPYLNQQSRCHCTVICNHGLDASPFINHSFIHSLMLILSSLSSAISHVHNLHTKSPFNKSNTFSTCPLVQFTSLPSLDPHTTSQKQTKLKKSTLPKSRQTNASPETCHNCSPLLHDNVAQNYLLSSIPITLHPNINKIKKTLKPIRSNSIPLNPVSTSEQTPEMLSTRAPSPRYP